MKNQDRKKTQIRFPNESYFIETEIDLTQFKPEQEFEDTIFGWYGGVFIEIKK